MQEREVNASIRQGISQKQDVLSSVTKEGLKEAGFSLGMPVKYRIMPGCIVITTQNIDELWQCLEGLSVEPFSEQQQQLTDDWLKHYPNGLAAKNRVK